jgi:hypothetical protein
MEKSRLNLLVWAAMLGTVGTGCSSQGPVTIGDQQPTTQLKTGLAAFAANWDGYVEAYKFTDGSDRVRIVVAEDGTGSVQFGNDALLPKPTDPNVKFPPDFPMCADCYLSSLLPDVWGGFQFTLNDVHVATDRLQASASNQEIFGAWCKLQTSHHNITSNMPEYSCSGCPGQRASDGNTLSDTCTVPSPCPNYAILDAAVPFVPSPCEREILCNGSGGTVLQEVKQTCVCDANGCGIGTPDQNIKLDAALADSQTTLTGTLVLTKASGSPSTNYTVRLKRQ